MSDVIELHNWSAYKFGKHETRLAGYVDGRCVVTEPVINVESNNNLVDTADGKVFKLWQPLGAADKMEIMYTIDRFCNVKEKAPPTDVTFTFTEELQGKKE